MLDLQEIINYFLEKAKDNISDNDRYKNYRQMARWLGELASYKRTFGDWNKLVEQDNTLSYIAHYYGYDTQSQLTIEECSELIKAISKYNRMRDKTWETHEYFRQTDVFTNLIEEVADVQLMLLQIIFLTGIEDNVREMVTTKINRQNDRIDEERKNMRNDEKES